MDLTALSIEELRAELQRHEDEEKEKAKPRPAEYPDFTNTIVLCQSYIDTIYSEGWVDRDHKLYIAQSALEAVFGDNVWKWIEKNARRELTTT